MVVVAGEHAYITRIMRPMPYYLPNIRLSRRTREQLEDVKKRSSVVATVSMSRMIRDAVHALAIADLHAAAKGKRWDPASERTDASEIPMPKVFVSKNLLDLMNRAIEWRQEAAPSFNASRFIREAIRKRLSAT